MFIEEKTVIDQVEVTRNGFVQVRRADLVLRDGVEIAKTYHRHALAPGDDLTGQDSKVVAIAQAAWTPDVIAAYQASQATV